MSYDDKARMRRPAYLDAPAEPHDSGRFCAPDPSMPDAEKLAWYQVFSHVLLLSSSERLRRAAAAEADREHAKRLARV